jgi:hypothetical protein
MTHRNLLVERRQTGSKRRGGVPLNQNDLWGEKPENHPASPAMQRKVTWVNVWRGAIKLRS